MVQVQNQVQLQKHVQNVVDVVKLFTHNNHSLEQYKMCKHVLTVVEQVRLLKKNVQIVMEAVM